MTDGFCHPKIQGRLCKDFLLDSKFGCILSGEPTWLWKEPFFIGKPSNSIGHFPWLFVSIFAGGYICPDWHDLFPFHVAWWSRHVGSHIRMAEKPHRLGMVFFHPFRMVMTWDGWWHWLYTQFGACSFTSHFSPQWIRHKMTEPGATPCWSPSNGIDVDLDTLPASLWIQAPS